MSEIIFAVSNKRSRINLPRVALKTLFSSLNIAWGGSVGAVGAGIRLGSAISSFIGRRLHLSSHLVKVMVGSGVAASFAAYYKAPLTGVLFAVEVVLREFEVEVVILLVLASVIAESLAEAYIPSGLRIHVPPYNWHGAGDLFLFAAVGLLAGVMSVYFVRIFYLQFTMMEKKNISWYGRALIAGVAIGLVGIWLPEVLAVNRRLVTSEFLTSLTMWDILGIAFFTPVLAGLTLAGGGSGGIVVPGLGTGAAVGAVFGVVCTEVFHLQTMPPGAFAIVGAAALFSANVRAPFTGVLLVLELTGNSSLLLPVMIGIVMATLVSKRFVPESIYEVKLLRRKDDIVRHQTERLLTELYVEDVLSTEAVQVPVGTPAAEVVRLFDEQQLDFMVVLEDDGRLVGLIYQNDVRYISKAVEAVIAADMARVDQAVLIAEQNLLVSFHEMSLHNIPAMAVVDDRQSRKFIGVVTRKDLDAEYHKERDLMKHM